MGAFVMQPMTKEDVSLVAETLAGNQLSFQLLVERYQDRMFGLVRHYTRSPVEIEDIVQDTFLKAFTRLSSFQQQSSFYTWLCRIAINTALDFHKRHGRNPVQAVEDPELAIAADRHDRPGRSGSSLQAPDARLERAEIQTITHRVLEELPEIFRAVLILREFEDMAYQDMADVLGISIGTVESRLFRARARFKDKLLQLHPEFGEE
ncbi:MAG TPA: sigma-70 family RNA polymerase sigma factor [Planctomycetota bacterium]|nr:sigma-70 family RNA polymerase sigma factor [Planctomycetota bacterium]